MRYLKLYENFRWNGDIMKMSSGGNWKDVNLSKYPVQIENMDKILNIITKKHEYISNNKNLIIVFALSEAKIFDKIKFNMREYSPAEVRYCLRIYQFQYYWGEDEDIYMFQWVSKLFVTKEHRSQYVGDAQSETYICRDLYALLDLIDDFQDFLDDKSQHNFKTDYPIVTTVN